MFNTFLQAMLKAMIAGALAVVKADAAGAEAFLAPFLAQGEAAVEAAAAKFNPIVGMLVTAAIAALGPDAPKLEGDAVAWIEALLTAWEAKV
jgi:hypothetical protein